MKVLLIKTSSMGDIIHTLPALTDAMRIFPDIEFTWVVEEGFAEIPAWHYSVKRVIPMALRKWRKHPITGLKSRQIQQFLHVLRDTKYDLIIDAQSLIKSSIVAKLSHGITCGLDWSSAREPLASLLYQRKFAISKKQHAITRIRQLFAQALNYPVPHGFPESNINLPDSNLAIDPSKYLVFIHGTTRDDKTWSESNWIALAKFAAQAGYLVKMPAYGTMEKQRVERIAARADNVYLITTSHLMDLAQIIQSAQAVVAVDTGLCHLTAALNVPLVSLYGPTEPDLIGAYSKLSKHIRSEDNIMNNIPVITVWKSLQLHGI